MALTRKFLSALGIEADKIDEIIEAHTETVNGLKEERDTYKVDAEKLAGVQKELKEANKKLSEQGDDGFEQKYNDIKKEFDEYKEEQANKEVVEKKTNAYKDLLKSAGVSEKRLDTILKVTSLDDIELDDEGKLKGSEDIEKSIKSEWADFIVTEGVKGADTNTPPSKEDGGEVDLGSLSMEEYIAARNKQ